MYMHKEFGLVLYITGANIKRNKISNAQARLFTCGIFAVPASKRLFGNVGLQLR